MHVPSGPGRYTGTTAAGEPGELGTTASELSELGTTAGGPGELGMTAAGEPGELGTTAAGDPGELGTTAGEPGELGMTAGELAWSSILPGRTQSSGPSVRGPPKVSNLHGAARHLGVQARELQDVVDQGQQGRPA